MTGGGLEKRLNAAMILMHNHVPETLIECCEAYVNRPTHNHLEQIQGYLFDQLQSKELAKPKMDEWREMFWMHSLTDA